MKNLRIVLSVLLVGQLVNAAQPVSSALAKPGAQCGASCNEDRIMRNVYGFGAATLGAVSLLNLFEKKMELQAANTLFAVSTACCLLNYEVFFSNNLKKSEERLTSFLPLLGVSIQSGALGYCLYYLWPRCDISRKVWGATILAGFLASCVKSFPGPKITNRPVTVPVVRSWVEPKPNS